MQLNKNPIIDRKAKIKIILIVLLMCIAFLILNNNGMITLFQVKHENQILIEKKETLEAKRIELLEEKEKLQHDKKYIEKTAREQYNMVKPGEKVYKVIEE
ncbi:MAG: septum formation initiator family protein [Candidatus Marinimicrobia bacterium]|nr:septum formation initiator family protein [Candidatus Neomarinimicrobiota bacterium]